MSTITTNVLPDLAPPRRRSINRGDRNFFGIVTAGVLFVPVLVLLFLVVLIAGAWPAMQAFGWDFLSSNHWDANASGGASFGALPFIYGTLVTGLCALLVAAPIGIGVATFLSEIDTSRLSYATATLVAAPVVCFMSPVCTVTDFTGSGTMFLAILAFLAVGGAMIRFLSGEKRLIAVAIAGLPAVFLSARLVAGDHVARLPLIFIGMALATAAIVLVIRRARSIMPFLLEILATIPSVVYGMWGLFVLAPWIAEHVQPLLLKSWQPLINDWFGTHLVGRRQVPNFPLFYYPGFPTGLGLGTAVLVLSVMILPMIVSLSLDALRSVPNSYREAALGLGATRWEVIRMAVLPPARSGIFGACILALGRALGETMAVTMVIGNDTAIRASVFGKGYSIASIIANEYGEADGLKLAALMELALILFVITLTVNLLARLFVRKRVSGMGPIRQGMLKLARMRVFWPLQFWPYLGWALVGAVAGVPVSWALASWGVTPAAGGAGRWVIVGIGAAGTAVGYHVLSAVNAIWRRFKNRLSVGVMGALLLICLVPLGALSFALIREGSSSVSATFLQGLPKPPGEPDGGVGNAILGSFMLLIFSAVFAVPLGLALGIYLTQRGTTKLASVTRLLLDVLSGIPAIIVGVFIYATVVRKTGVSLHLGLSTLAGALALAMIMLPIFARASEEALKSIPRTVDEAGLGLGLPRRTVVLRILIRAAIPAILTGLFLALARVGGEAAPLLFTTQSSNFWPSHATMDLLSLKPLREPVASLPLVIFEYQKSPYEEWKRQAWGASLVLVTLVLLIRLSTHAYTAWRYGAKEAHV